MKRSKHSLSHYRLTSLNMGQLYPVMCEEVLPGDTFRHQSSVLMRVSPLVAPVMHPVHCMVHSWFVPSRILWSSFEDFMTGKNTAVTVPVLQLNSSEDADCWKLAQSLGVGAQDIVTDIELTALPFRAYNMIYNEFYRDQDLTASLTVPVGDSGDNPDFYKIRNLQWEKDYFTTARPFPQQGEDTEVVQLSLSGRLPVHGIGTVNQSYNTDPGQTAYETDGTGATPYTNWKNSAGGATADLLRVQEDPDNAGFPNIHVQLEDAEGPGLHMDINAWRRSLAMQRLREHRNRYGSRYRDMLAFLGIRSSDSRLQRPEYLGGGKATIAFSEVLSTVENSDSSQPLGSLGGHGIAAMRTRPYRRFFEEHGYVLSFLAVRPQSIYINRVPRHFLRREYSDFWQKELEALGEQEITNFEVYGDATSPGDTFGYIPRYDEYRHAQSFVSGEFRTVLDHWHMARLFEDQPVLNGSFVECDPTDRIYASTNTDQLYAMVAHRIAARRLVSKRARA